MEALEEDSNQTYKEKRPDQMSRDQMSRTNISKSVSHHQRHEKLITKLISIPHPRILTLLTLLRRFLPPSRLGNWFFKVLLSMRCLIQRWLSQNLKSSADQVASTNTLIISSMTSPRTIRTLKLKDQESTSVLPLKLDSKVPSSLLTQAWLNSVLNKPLSI